MKTSLNDWQNAGKWSNILKACDCSSSKQRLIISRSSLTNALEKIYKGTVEVEKIRKATPDRITVDYLGLQKSPECIKREVWLTVKGKRLIHATTVLLPVFARYARYGDILTSNLPLGRTLSSQNIRFRKKSIEIGILTDKRINKGFGLTKDYTLFARRYKLIGMGGCLSKSTDKIFGAVIEVFSPELTGRAPRPDFGHKDFECYKDSVVQSRAGRPSLDYA